MPKPIKKSTKIAYTQVDVTRITRTLYFFIGFFALSIVIFDSGNLINREAVIDRWTIATLLLIINTTVWFVASKSIRSLQGLLVSLLSATLLAFAGFLTYWENGMDSSSTILFVLPLLVIATLKNRHALLATATLSAGTYAFATVKHFNDFFNEGYRVELWGKMLLYSAVIFTSAWLIMILTGLRHDSK